MQVSIDKAGRILVPKPVRDRLGLREDCKLELVETPEGFFLKPPNRRSGVSRDKDGWLVISGEPTGTIDWDRLVEADREERMEKIAGL
jgi:AbrB family looped-hinge helix DNA binding protein